MVFSSTVFLFLFLPITLLGYFLIKEKYQNWWLLFVSIIFFSWSQPNNLWIILVNILINYLGALLISKVENKVINKIVLILTILLNIGILYYFKYYDFTIESINKLFSLNLEIKNIILPIGISFFTFQGLSYIVDVSRKNIPVQKNIFKVALYIVLFPQLIAGPIVRYVDVAKEIDSRKVDYNDFYEGVKRFIIGLFKKVIIANTMAVIVDNIWNLGVAQNTVAIAWLGIISYSLQIYFDFSGYSDMAIGLGRLFGFHFNENFNLPYISKSITEFWRRWHISLSSWFRDYVYIPLGGNRKRVYLNLAIIFLLTGLWHGAAYNFIFWGIWHGIFIIIERILKKKQITIKLPNVLKNLFCHIYTLIVVIIGWIFFRANGLKNALKYLLSMFGIGLSSNPQFNVLWYLNRWNVLVLILAIILSTSIPSKIINYLENKWNKKAIIIIQNILLLLMLFICILKITSNTYNPFIYFQF